MSDAWVEVDLHPERAGWAVVTMHGSFTGAAAVRLLGTTLLDLLAEGHEVLTLDLGRCRALSAAVAEVLVQGARHAHRAGGTVVVSGVAPDAALRGVLGEADVPLAVLPHRGPRAER